MSLRIDVESHPLLALRGFVAQWSTALGQMPQIPWLTASLRPRAVIDADPTVVDGTPWLPAALDTLGGSDDTVRAAVRTLLRHGGYKPSGRGKPASEYLLAAAAEGTIGPINTAVDLCNAVSMHAGLPISVVDLDRATPPFRLGLAPDAARYVFNATGQEIDLSGLLCLHDAEGPCANAVKDSQRTKTNADTTQVLCVVWGSRAVESRVDATVAVYRSLTERCGAAVGDVELRREDASLA